MPRLGKGPRTLGQQPISHPKAPPLRADPRSRTGFVKGTHTEKLAPRDTHEAWSWPQDGSKNHPTEANMRKLVHPSTLYHRTRLLPFTRVHVVPLPKLPFLLLSLWRTPMHPSRSSSNVPSSEAFPDPVMFPHPISGLLASCILTTSLLASMLLFLLPQM